MPANMFRDMACWLEAKEWAETISVRGYKNLFETRRLNTGKRNLVHHCAPSPQRSCENSRSTW